MKLAGLEIDESKLLSKAELLDYLKKNGATDKVLADIRERYYDTFGNELCWKYPISDGWHNGTFIIAGRDGFLSLPYDEIDSENYELLLLDDACFFDAAALKVFLEDFNSYAEDLTAALQDMEKIVSGRT